MSWIQVIDVIISLLSYSHSYHLVYRLILFLFRLWVSAFLPQLNMQSYWTTTIHGSSTVMEFCGEAIIWSKESLKCWICYAVEVCWSNFTDQPRLLQFTFIPKKDKKVVFVTNNAAKSRKSYKSKFDQLGVQTHVVSSMQPLPSPLNLFQGCTEYIGWNLRVCIRRCSIPFLRNQAS